MILLTISDATDSMTFSVIKAPAIKNSIINETDVETIDGNISTYYSSMKKEYEIGLGFLDSEAYGRLEGIRDRQYLNREYPLVTITGDSTFSVSEMSAKLTISRQEVVDNCETVRNVTVTLRESRRMP